MPILTDGAAGAPGLRRPTAVYMQRLRMKLSQGDPVSLKPADRTGGSRTLSLQGRKPCWSRRVFGQGYPDRQSLIRNQRTAATRDIEGRGDAGADKRKGPIVLLEATPWHAACAIGLESGGAARPPPGTVAASRGHTQWDDLPWEGRMLRADQANHTCLCE